MFQFIKKREDKLSIMYPVLQRLSRFMVQQQRNCAGWLQRRVAHYSKRTLIALLALFCLLFGGGSMLIVIDVLQGGGKTFFVQQIKVPAHVIDTVREQESSPAVTDKVYQKIVRFRRYIDSLYKHHPAGIDSINQTRPGLIDSLRFIELIYSKQLK